jgi:hypothetical protein
MVCRKNGFFSKFVFKNEFLHTPPSAREQVSKFFSKESEQFIDTIIDLKLFSVSIINSCSHVPL